MMAPLKLLDLFSGIGGFSLGLERSGAFETVAFCEIEDFPRRVLAKHWPKVPCYEDVRTLTAKRLAADGITVDAICGGFPCQDISVAGKGAGLAGERSGLWREIARLAGELRPRFIILENVSALLGRGLGDVLGDLAALGYDAEWHCIPASAVGAPHRRDRIWIVAYSPFMQCDGGELYREHAEGKVSELRAGSGSQPLAYAESKLRERRGDTWKGRLRPANSGQDMADANSLHEQGQQSCQPNPQEWTRPILRSLRPCRDGNGWWRVEPNVGRVAYGIPDRSHRLKGLGNAVVPQIPELIGRAIAARLAA